MHLRIEDLQGLWKRITITVLCDYIDKEIEKKFQILSKTIRIDGFRIGKVPISFLREKYGTFIHQNVIHNLMEKNFFDIVSKNNIRYVNHPQYEIIKPYHNLNKKFIYSVIVEIYPKIKLRGLDNIIIEKPLVCITDKDVDWIINRMKQKYTLWENNENKKITVGDRVTFEIKECSPDKSLMNNIFCYNNGSIIMIIGRQYHDTVYHLEQKMLGCVMGDTFEIYFDLSKKNYIANLDEKCVSFIVKIKKVETAKYSRLHQNYFTHFDREKIKKNIQSNLHRSIRKYIKNQIINSILNTNFFEVPITLLQIELNTLKNKIKNPVYYIDDYMAKKSLYSLVFEEFNLKYHAQCKIQSLLLFSEIIKFAKINIDDEIISQSINQNFGFSDYSKKIIRLLKNDVIMKNYFSSALLEELVIDFIIKQAKIIEKELTFINLVVGCNTIASYH